MRKYLSGQGASEYLIILAVVLLVALVAIALLGAFPSVGGDARMSETRQYWSSQAPFSILDYNQYGASMSLTLKNTGNDLLAITNLTIGNVTGNYPLGLMFSPGAQKTVTLTNFRNCSAGDYDYIQYNVVITYNTTYLSTTQIGNKPLIGPCNVQ